MGAIDEYLKKQRERLNLDHLVSDEIKKFDSLVPPQSLFKFIPDGRLDFFGNPLLRFTQREGLNDPFELMKRWNEFAPASFRSIVAEHLKTIIQELKNNKHHLLAMLKEHTAKQGVFFGPAEVAQASLALLAPETDSKIAAFIDHSTSGIDEQSELAFRYLTAASESAFSETTEKIGILSLTDHPTSRVMWSLYASSGRGFLIEFDTKHPFFKAPNGRTLLWPVSYRDEPQGSFLENPMSLFITKHADYRFEREWRILRNLDECDETITRPNGVKMYMRKVVPGMIRSITFGYNFDAKQLPVCGALLTAGFDNAIKLRWMSVNRRTGDFDFHPLN